MPELWSDKSRERMTSVEERRGLATGPGPDPVLARQQAELEARQREAEERVAEEAAQAEARRQEIRRRVEAEVGALGFTVQLGEMVVRLVVRPTLSTEQRARLSDALQRLVAVALEAQRAAAVAVSYPELEPFAYEARSWREEFARLLVAMRGEGLIELEERS